MQNLLYSILNATIGRFSYTAYQVNAKGEVERTRLDKFLSPILSRLHQLVGSDWDSV